MTTSAANGYLNVGMKFVIEVGAIAIGLLNIDKLSTTGSHEQQ